jgi:hypothetical protein
VKIGLQKAITVPTINTTKHFPHPDLLAHLDIDTTVIAQIQDQRISLPPDPEAKQPWVLEFPTTVARLHIKDVQCPLDVKETRYSIITTTSCFPYLQNFPISKPDQPVLLAQNRKSTVLACPITTNRTILIDLSWIV